MRKINFLGWLCLYILPTIILSGQPAVVGNSQTKNQPESIKVKSAAVAIAPSPQAVKAIQKENEKLREVNDKKDDSIKALTKDLKESIAEPKVKYIYRYKTKTITVSRVDTVWLPQPIDENDYTPDTVYIEKHDTICVIKKEKRGFLRRIFNN